jgi:hypothetical protein
LHDGSCEDVGEFAVDSDGEGSTDPAMDCARDDNTLEVAQDTADDDDAEGEIGREGDGDARGKGTTGFSH